MKSNKIILTILFFIFLVATVALIALKEVNIALFCTLFTVFIAILLFRSIKVNSSPEKVYEGTVNNILKTYEVILIEVENLPDFSERKIIDTKSFTDLVNIEYEYRKPVYFIHNEYSYDFMLMTDEDLYTYTIKRDNEQKSILEKFLEEKNKEGKESQKQLDVIDSLENTAVIKIDNDKEFVVSPIRSENSSNSSATNNKV